jgi:peptide/nickel transport system substrate-binding protein
VSGVYLRIVPEGTARFLDGTGTGPYALTSFEPGVRANGKRNPNYFKTDRAHFDEVSLLVVPDESARIAAMRADEIDAMDRLSFKVINLVQNLPGMRVLEVPGQQHFTLPMLADRPPFESLDLRLAMKFAVDREAILKLVLGGHGSLGNDQPISRDSRFFNSELPQRKYDPDKAKFHLRKAGMESQRFELHASEAAFAGSVDLGTLVKESAAKAGINVDLVRDPNDGYWSKVWQKVPWFSSWWAGRPTEDWMFTSTYAPGPFNESHWNNARFNELLVAARGEADTAKRRQMYWEIQRIVSDEGATIIPVFANYVTLVSAKIGHDKVSPMWILDGYKATERWWFA